MLKSKRLWLALLTMLVLVAQLPDQQLAAMVQDDSSIEKFKKYVSGRLSDLTEAQLDAIAKRVDSDGNGTISDDEFEKRMDAIEATLSGETEKPAEPSKEMKKKPAENTDDEAKAKPQSPKKKAVDDLANRADVLVITSSDLAKSWKKFATWKTQTGRPTKVVSTDEISENFEGKDIQQKIRECCLEHIAKSGTIFVILGGDSSEDEGCVPDRDTDHSSCKMLPYDNIPTDVYYISEKDWDANDDGVYGSFEDDMEAVAYTNPKACIGRIPVRTTADVVAYTDKVIAYESNYPVGKFANRMVYTCSVEHAYPKLGTSVKNLTESWSGDIQKFYSDKTPWDDQVEGDYDLTPATWAKMINDRDAAKIHMHGHGLLPLWILEGHSKLTSSTVKSLNNKNAYPIITTVSCLTGQFDNAKDPCIAESMIRQPNAGAIAVLAPSREGVPFMHNPKEDFPLMMEEGKMDGTTTAYTKFWQVALKEGLTLGEAFKQVKMDMTSDARRTDGFHMIQCELNLFGDPTLDPRPTPPVNFKGQVKVQKDKIIATGFAGAKICVWDGAGHYEVVTADSGSSTEIELGEHKGTYSIAAFGSGFNTWLKEDIVVE